MVGASGEIPRQPARNEQLLARHPAPVDFGDLDVQQVADAMERVNHEKRHPTVPHDQTQV